MRFHIWRMSLARHNANSKFSPSILWRKAQFLGTRVFRILGSHHSALAVRIEFHTISKCNEPLGTFFPAHYSGWSCNCAQPFKFLKGLFLRLLRTSRYVLKHARFSSQNHSNATCIRREIICVQRSCGLPLARCPPPAATLSLAYTILSYSSPHNHCHL